jgi:hypothetical protein
MQHNAIRGEWQAPRKMAVGHFLLGRIGHSHLALTVLTAASHCFLERLHLLTFGDADRDRFKLNWSNGLLPTATGIRSWCFFESHLPSWASANGLTIRATQEAEIHQPAQL